MFYYDQLLFYEFSYMSMEKTTILAPNFSFTFTFIYPFTYTTWHRGKLHM